MSEYELYKHITCAKSSNSSSHGPYTQYTDNKVYGSSILIIVYE